MKKAYMIYPSEEGKAAEVVLAGSFAAAAVVAEELFPGTTYTSGVRSIEFLGKGQEVDECGK